MKSGRGTFNYLSGPEFTGPDRALGVAGSSGSVAAADEGEASAPGPAPRQGGGAGTAPRGSKGQRHSPHPALASVLSVFFFLYTYHSSSAWEPYVAFIIAKKHNK